MARAPYGETRLALAWQAGYEEAVRDLTPQLVQTDRLSIDLHSAEIRIDSQIVRFSAIETRVLQVLASHLGRLVHEKDLSRAILNLDNVDLVPYQSRRKNLDNVIHRIRKKFQAYHLNNLIYAGSQTTSSRMLARRPCVPSGVRDEEEDRNALQEETSVGYSRVEVRSTVQTALKFLEEGEIEQAEAVLQDAVEHIQTRISTGPIGRPNHDQKYLDTLLELGANERYVSVGEIADYLGIPHARALKQLRRLRARRPEVKATTRRGYYLEGAVLHSQPDVACPNPDWIPRTNMGIPDPKILAERARRLRQANTLIKARIRERDNPDRQRRAYHGRVSKTSTGASVRQKKEPKHEQQRDSGTQP